MIGLIMQDYVSSLQDVNFIFLNLEYLFLRCTYEDCFQKKCKILSIAIHDRISKLVAIIAFE